MRKIKYLELKLIDAEGICKTLGVFETISDLYDYMASEVEKALKSGEGYIATVEIINSIINLEFDKVKDIVDTLFSSEELGRVAVIKEIDTYKPVGAIAKLSKLLYG
ncbi:hypothetical protein [Campylobacter hyointestinalis]|uniref:Uncharacterized protein n=1 Tax=Campylobacter hyointestinalis subsp. hyointestinalis TaxID=91352 RepID=A0A0S4SP97_CAMHY|nr:hypothetical protein [Campylobacter hyointestinalis]PPB51696.1 hypothetical protein CDQ69_08830 [Campylobacter hyointestinalis subsp. hyointestinalis]PPB55989.1 hypothetical protein CDQ67_01760 [Campylobacter hyointestinalis subsp. hyointestinalis]PPB61436.1 hypothetical protein CDQ74_08630 [Campylobacter hyointestinalis subsp. hyointestinalis]CUU71281.1 Uncharacterised protein [Campylobacter hyointestinalis subsp. hyointestinalis]CUU87543.1 Uncharacterised protein [Campylobacter hyointesti